MGGKKKKGKSKKDKGDKDDAEAKEEPIPLVLDNYLQLEFRMLNWKFMNFGQRFKETTNIFTIKKLLAERHGRVEDMKICIDAFSEANEIKDEMLTLKECGLKGRAPNMIRAADGSAATNQRARLSSQTHGGWSHSPRHERGRVSQPTRSPCVE